MQTILKIGTALGALWTLAATPAAQFDEYARASLYTKVDGDVLLAAVEIHVDLGWHLYDLDKGPGVGQALTLDFGGEGLTWGEVRGPEPHRHDQPAIGDQPATYVMVHYGGTSVFYAAAALDDEESAANAVASVAGLTCEDAPMGTCVQYDDPDLSSSGEGRASLWEAFPASILPVPDDDWTSGEADATLYSRVRDGRVLAAIQIEITPEWHLYHDDLGGKDGLPTTVTMGGEGVVWGPALFPEPVLDAAGHPVHHGRITVVIEGTLEGESLDGHLSAEIKGQTCADGPGGVCIPYGEVIYDRGEGPDALFADFGKVFLERAEADEAEAATAHGGDEEEQQGLLAFLGLAVFWGLFTLLMPCTYPMIPITISFFTKQAEARGGNVLPLSLLYGAGIVLIFILIGVVIGAAIIPFATHPITNLVIAAFFVVFAFALFGMINLQPPAALMSLAGKASMTGGYLGVFFMGACLVVTSFTCTAPFVGSLLSVGASDGDLGRIVIGMGAFGLTMAVPFVLLSLVPGKIAAMPKSGQWMNTLKVTLGFVELAAALKFLSNADLVWHWEVFSRELFLLLWCVIFAAAAAYLFFFAGGKPRKVTAGRSVAAAVLLLLVGYFFYGYGGRNMDPIMTAIIPPYSGGKITPQNWVTGARHQIVVDDYQAAVELAQSQNKLVLVNFTGHT